MNEDLDGLGLVELLERLQPIADPVPVSMWPQTDAWIFVGLALAAIMAWGVARWRRRRAAEAYRREALRAIASAEASPAALAEILRRTAIAAYPRATVAGLHGEAWLSFLDEAYGGSGFVDGPGRVLSTAPYAATSDAGGASEKELLALSRTWIRRHRREKEAAA